MMWEKSDEFCPNCASSNTEQDPGVYEDNAGYLHHCKDCDYQWMSVELKPYYSERDEKMDTAHQRSRGRI